MFIEMRLIYQVDFQIIFPLNFTEFRSYDSVTTEKKEYEKKHIYMTFVSIERFRRAFATAFPFLDISHPSELTYFRFISQHVDDATIGGTDVKQDLPIDNCEGQELFAVIHVSASDQRRRDLYQKTVFTIPVSRPRTILSSEVLLARTHARGHGTSKKQNISAEARPSSLMK